MNLDIQFKLKTSPAHKTYLRQNCMWYKELNRYPEKWDEFDSEMKEVYKLRPTDKLNNILNQIEMVQSIMNVLK